MNIKTRVLSIAGAAIIALGTITGVAADKPTTDATEADVTVQVSAPSGGTLNWGITVPTGFTAVTGSLDSEGTSQGGLLLTVQDTRFTRVGWELSISGSDFTGITTGGTLAVGNFSVAPGKLTVLAGDTGVTPASGSIQLGSEGQSVISAAKGSGSGSYSLPLTGTMTVPANTMADTYVSTITVDQVSAP